MTRHHAALPPSGFAPAEVLIPVYLHVQSRRAGKIKGEAKAPGHVDEIEVTAWLWRAQASAAMNGTASMGRFQCTYRALTIYKRIDTATTALMWALARNDEFREVRLTMRRPVSSDGVQEDVFTITLNDARVVALDHEVAADGSSREGVTIESKVVQTHYQSGKPPKLVVAHRLPAPQPAQKAIAPALGVGAPGGQVARNAAIEPVRSFREASMAQRKLDDAKALAEHQARLASQPMQYVGPIDDAGNARAAMAQQRTANNLAAALGGPFVAAPMLTARAAGLDESQVDQAGMLGLAALDAAGVKGGVSVTRLGSKPRGLVGLTPAEQAGRLAKTGDGAEGATGLRNGHLAGSVHPKTGVPFDKAGFPDFSGVAKAEVKITQTGSRAGDFRAANEAAGLKKTPEGYTWHHHQDGKTMQLVSRDIHSQTGHTGGFQPGP